MKKGELLPAISLKHKLNDSEKKLIKKLAQFPELIAKSARDYQSYYLADYLLDVADLFNSFYENSPVIKAADSERGTRAAIVSSTAVILKTGLQLLGIGVPEKM